MNLKTRNAERCGLVGWLVSSRLNGVGRVLRLRVRLLRGVGLIPRRLRVGLERCHRLALLGPCHRCVRLGMYWWGRDVGPQGFGSWESLRQACAVGFSGCLWIACRWARPDRAAKPLWGCAAKALLIRDLLTLWLSSVGGLGACVRLKRVGLRGFGISRRGGSLLFGGGAPRRYVPISLGPNASRVGES